MCGRYTLTADYEELAEEFELREAQVLVPPRYNIAPTQTAVVIRAFKGGERELAMLRWGLVPSWARDPTLGSRMINARSEGVAEKPAFRNALRRRRCLVPASGFYEWKSKSCASGAQPVAEPPAVDEPGAQPPPPASVGPHPHPVATRKPAAAKSPKQPYLIRRRDRRLLAFAGLWERWHGPDGALETYTILTAPASASLAGLHDRMPVIVAPGDYAQWLDPALQSSEQVLPLLRTWPGELSFEPVSRRVNNPRIDDPACLQFEPQQ